MHTVLVPISLNTVAILAQGTTSWLATRSPVFVGALRCVTHMDAMLVPLSLHTVAILAQGTTSWLATRSPVFVGTNSSATFTKLLSIVELHEFRRIQRT
jgi:3-polyprenyl-4-hydroxybenzoate decarboxylase